MVTTRVATDDDIDFLVMADYMSTGSAEYAGSLPDRLKSGDTQGFVMEGDDGTLLTVNVTKADTVCFWNGFYGRSKYGLKRKSKIFIDFVLQWLHDNSWPTQGYVQIRMSNPQFPSLVKLYESLGFREESLNMILEISDGKCTQ